MDSEGRISDLDLCAARDLLRWTQVDLAERSGVGIMTIRRFETGTSISDGRRDALKRALTDAGIVFFGRSRIEGVAVSGGVALRPEARPADIRKSKPYQFKKGARKGRATIGSGAHVVEKP